MKEKREYLYDEEVKQTVINIEKFHYNILITKEELNNYGSKIIDHTKEMAAHRLCDGLSQFVGTIEQERPDGKEIIATIYLPYVRDQLLEEAEKKRYHAERAIDHEKETVRRLKKQIEYLKLPWYKKIWRNNEKQNS